MNIYSTYSVKIKHYNNIFKDTIKIYRQLVNFYIDVALKEEIVFKDILGDQFQSYQMMQEYTLSSKARPKVAYDVKEKFTIVPPVTLRTAAINEAIGKVSSYYSNLDNWNKSTEENKKSKPSIPRAGYCYPALYRNTMYKRIDDYHAQIKIFYDKKWRWLDIELRKGDVDYIIHHCSNMKDYVPTLQKRGKEWFLDFPFSESCTLNKTPIKDQTIIAVHSGINASAVIVAMKSDGTILGRHFLKLSKEYDTLNHKISHIKRAQHQGSIKLSNLWAYARGTNDDIAVKTAAFIIDNAIKYKADVIVLEHLDLGGKKKGPKKQILALWNARYVQEMVEHKAHSNCMRISTVNTYNVSKLAYDGSGEITQTDSFFMCKFPNGKIYNKELNAAYNIGARYYVREIIKSLTEKEKDRIISINEDYDKRSKCTLSTLYSLNEDLKK